MGELMGDDRVESGVVVHKEHPDVGVFISQVTEGDVKSGGVRGRPVACIGVPLRICGDWNAALNVGQYHSLEALYDDQSECYWPVIQAGVLGGSSWGGGQR